MVWVSIIDCFFKDWGDGFQVMETKLNTLLFFVVVKRLDYNVLTRSLASFDDTVFFIQIMIISFTIPYHFPLGPKFPTEFLPMAVSWMRFLVLHFYFSVWTYISYQALFQTESVSVCYTTFKQRSSKQTTDSFLSIPFIDSFTILKWKQIRQSSPWKRGGPPPP